MSIEKYRAIIRNPKLLFCILGKRKIFFWLPDIIYLRIAYFIEMGRKLDLEKPVRYSEKIQWVKLYDRKEIYPILVDKIKVRHYIEETIGSEYLIPSYGDFDEPEDIDYDLLPEAFVIKCNHASSTNIICTDKSELDIRHANKLLKKWMKLNWYWYGREWAYKEVVPRLLIEKYISDTDMVPDDFKIVCCNGVPKVIEVHRDRYNDYRINCYDMNWELLDIDSDEETFSEGMEKPACFDEMIRLSKVLAANTYIARVDWFIVGGRLYFGEITLYEASGFVCKRCDYTDKFLGSLIQLPI